MTSRFRRRQPQRSLRNRDTEAQVPTRTQPLSGLIERHH